MALAKKRFRLKASSRVVSCYEAGRDGFWIHRCLEGMGIENVVVDSSSIEVNRRKRRAKTDRLDVGKLVTMLVRYHGGEEKVWSVVRVPSEADEDRRHLHRSPGETKRERTRMINRIKGLLTTQGVRVRIDSHFLEELEQERTWDDRPLPPGLVDRVKRAHAYHQFLTQQIYQLEKARRAAVRLGEGEILDKVRQLKQLRGIGMNSSWLFVMEFFGRREFRNRREVGSLAGLTPTPYDSGGSDREQGIGLLEEALVVGLAGDHLDQFFFLIDDVDQAMLTRDPPRPDLTVEILQPFRLTGTRRGVSGDLSNQVERLDVALPILLAKPFEVRLRLIEDQDLPGHVKSEKTSATDFPRPFFPASCSSKDRSRALSAGRSMTKRSVSR